MRNKTINRLLSFCGAICLSLAVLASPAAEFPSRAAAAQDEAIMPLSDGLVWKYAVMDDKLYRRLYNASKKCWAGEWMYVMDLTRM